LQLIGGVTINIKDYEKIRFSVGFGENNFTMSRGSFKYKQKFEWKQELVLDDCQKHEDDTESYQLTFIDKKQNDHYYLNVSIKDGTSIITSSEDNANTMKPNRYWLTLPCDKEEHFYGCGETYSEFDLKGLNVRIWVAEHQNTKRIATKLIKQKLTGVHPEKKLKFDQYESYYVQPTFTSSKKYYVHANINRYAEFDFRKPGQITFYTQEPISIVSEYGDTFTEVSKRLSDRLGRQRKLPEWVYDGGIMAVQDWIYDGKNTISEEKGIEKVDAKIKAAKDAGVKINGVWCQDWCGCRCTQFGYQVMWNWDYDRVKYPQLPEAIRRWKEEGVRYLGYINPFIALEKDIYKEAAANGYCVKDKDGKDYLVTITTFPAAMVDFTNPSAYEWYKNLIKTNMIGIGMGGWMADFGEYLPVDSVLFSGEDPEEMHNRWPAIWAKLNREAIEECNASEDVFFFTRAGHTETIKYSSMMWTGDQHVDWSVDDGLPSVIPATLSLAMSGYGITHSDVGGYTTIMQMTRSKELMLRWEEMNAFTPLFRSHEGNQPSRDVQFDDDEELLAQLAKFTNIHVGLKDYLKGLVKEQETMGTPAMRPLFYHYDEYACYTEKTEYLLGRDILVAPVYKEGAKDRQVYLPNDSWIHIFTGKKYTGGGVTIEAPVGQPPVFIRENSEFKNTLLALAGGLGKF